MLSTLDWIVISMFVGFGVLDFILRGRSFPDVKLWRAKGIFAFVVYFFVSGYSPFLWDGWLGQHTLFDASSLPIWLAALIGVFIVELGIYLWHRTLRSIPVLWRTFHQMHHSAERVDVFGAFYFHPLDMIGFSFVSSLALVGVFGMAPEAAFFVVVVTNFCAIFQHSNLKTPKWLGLFIMRPEQHAVHHERGVHMYNYGDIPHWDMLFGTYKNPEVFNSEVGFYQGASSKVMSMLTWHLVDEEL